MLELTPVEYRSVRETNRRFLVFPDLSHTDPSLETLSRSIRGFWVVEKNGEAGEEAENLAEGNPIRSRHASEVSRRPEQERLEPTMSVSHPHHHHPNEAASDFVNSRPFEWLARAGFVARGLVYGIIGLLALKLAIGSGGKATDQQGAMRTLAQQPFGKVLLLALAVGLAGYAMWRFTRAALGRARRARTKGSTGSRHSPAASSTPRSSCSRSRSY